MCRATRCEQSCMDCGAPTAKAVLNVQRCTELSCRGPNVELIATSNTFCDVCRDERRAKRKDVSARLEFSLGRIYRDEIETTATKHAAYLESLATDKHPSLPQVDEGEGERERECDDEATLADEPLSSEAPSSSCSIS